MGGVHYEISLLQHYKLTCLDFNYSSYFTICNFHPNSSVDWPSHSELHLNLAGEIFNFGGRFKHFATQTNIRFLWRGVHRKYVNHVLKAICQANLSQPSQLARQIQTQFTVPPAYALPCTVAAAQAGQSRIFCIRA